MTPDPVADWQTLGRELAAADWPMFISVLTVGRSMLSLATKANKTARRLGRLQYRVRRPHSPTK